MAPGGDAAIGLQGGEGFLAAVDGGVAGARGRAGASVIEGGAPRHDGSIGFQGCEGSLG